MNIEKSLERLAVLEKIGQLERARIFDQDVEQDPPTIPLNPDKIKYANNSLWSNIKRKIAYSMAYSFYNKSIKNKTFALGKITGEENFCAVDGGAIVTCNHFNPMDSFVMQKVLDHSGRKGRMYRVIREGNYTSFSGFYGFLMRNCDTLPLSDNMAVMKKFFRGVEKVLKNNHLVLVYPEQSMWWNYRKPKPLKPGAYMFAARNNVPVLPCFITMRDTDIMGEDGFPVQEYTIHIAEPIYPEEGVSYRVNMQNMMEKNALVWKEIYEDAYQMPLTYTTETE